MNTEQQIALRLWWIVGILCAGVGAYLIILAIWGSAMLAAGATLMVISALIMLSVMISWRNSG